MSVRDITADAVLGALHAGARTRDELAARFEVLSSSRWLTDALAELGVIVDQQDQLRSGRHACGLKFWDAFDLQPADPICTCTNPFYEEA